MGILSILVILARANRFALRSRVRTRVRLVRPTNPCCTPVIFVPGVLGTTMVDVQHGKFPVWGSYKGIFFYRDAYEDMDLSLSENGENRLQPGEVLWDFPVVPGLISLPIFRELAFSLESVGYVRDESALNNGSCLFLGLSYDWRRGVVEGARRLEEAVRTVQNSTGAKKIHLVGHSWGSTVIRYYLRYGGADMLNGVDERPRPGAGNIDTFFAVGAPFGGTFRALHEVNCGFAPAGPLGRPVMPHHMASSPVAYQLLPFNVNHVINESGESQNLSLAEVDTWRLHGWGPFRQKTFEALFRRARKHAPGLTRVEMESIADGFLRKSLAAGQRLWELMGEKNSLDKNVRTVVYASDNRPTLTHVVMRGSEVLATSDLVRRNVPGLFDRVTAPGDEYVPFSQIREYFDGLTMINDPLHTPDESYVCLVDAPSHRDLLKQGPLLDNLLLNICSARRRRSWM